MTKIKILVAEEQHILRQGLLQLLRKVEEFEVVAQVSCGKQLIEQIKMYLPQVVLFNVLIPNLDINELKQLSSKLPDVHYVALIKPESTLMQNLIQAGISNFLAPGFEVIQLVRAIHIAAQGRFFLHPDVAEEFIKKYKQLLDKLEGNDHDFQLVKMLTTREKEILTLLAEGYTNGEIADILYISVKTVRTHLGNIIKKLALKDRISLAFFAIRVGLL